jgi:hypothetical protein
VREFHCSFKYTETTANPQEPQGKGMRISRLTKKSVAVKSDLSVNTDKSVNVEEGRRHGEKGTKSILLYSGGQRRLLQGGIAHHG